MDSTDSLLACLLTRALRRARAGAGALRARAWLPWHRVLGTKFSKQVRGCAGLVNDGLHGHLLVGPDSVQSILASTASDQNLRPCFLQPPNLDLIQNSV